MRAAPWWRGSLTLRVVLLASLWLAAGLALTGWFVTTLAEQQIRAAEDARLATLLDAVIAQAGTDANGRPELARLPPNMEFNRPLSGHYWQVAGPGGVIASRSLWDARLPAPEASAGGAAMVRDITGPRGERLRLLERRVELPETRGPLLVQVALSREGSLAEIARLRRGLVLAFGLLGAGLVLGLAAQLFWAMRPLRQAREALAQVRAGERERLALPAPAEIAPLVEEVDALIAQNQATVERARTHVGNLAHALKTPVAVLHNALAAPVPDRATALAQLGVLEGVVRHHLARARASALAGSAAGSVAPLALAEEVAAALRRLPMERAITIAVQGEAALRLRADRQDLVEMLGNLLENACRWAASRVEVSVLAAGAGMLAIEVADDGPGLPPGDAEAVLARGVRLDEKKPGTGLGLAIVAELAALHGGRLALDRAALGGLRARLELPAAAPYSSPSSRSMSSSERPK